MPSLDTMMSYHRLKRSPLDDSEIFTCLADLMDYCETGACYNGQQVSVSDRNNIVVKYTIKEYNGCYYPIIDTKGSELIFNDIDGEQWLLVYAYNTTCGTRWYKNEVFTFDEEKLCILSQLEIFRLHDYETGNKYFEFLIDRQKRDGSIRLFSPWAQNVNPYPYSYNDSNSYNGIGENAGIEYDKNREKEQLRSYIKFNNVITEEGLDEKELDIMIMPYDLSMEEYEEVNENDYITKIYVKANDYYNALNNIELEVL